VNELSSQVGIPRFGAPMEQGAVGTVLDFTSSFQTTSAPNHSSAGALDRGEAERSPADREAREMAYQFV